MLPVVVIALLTAITVWWFLVQRLLDKPWTQQGVLPTSQEGITSSAPKVGLWVFLAVVSSFFGLFSSAYLMRMHHSAGSTHWQPLNEPGILWINTVVLVLASVAIQIARTRADRNDFAGVRGYFTAGGVLTLAVPRWTAHRLACSSEPPDFTAPVIRPTAFFILLTGLHGLHLVGGLFVLSRTATRVWRGVERQSVVARSQIRTSVQLCTLYWHWLLLIWLGLFALLLST